MNVSIKSFTAAAIAAATLGAAGMANAHEYGQGDWGRYDRYERYAERHDWRDACDAGRWDPQVRYMPGDVVRRHGELFMARRISARVWNVNSPPEWTPSYWVPARCE